MVNRYKFSVLNKLFIFYNKLDTPQKPRINPIVSTFGLKIFENIFYIVTKTGINIYSRNP